MAVQPRRDRFGFGVIDAYASDAAFLSALGQSPKRGDQYFNSTTLKYRYFNGTSWSDSSLPVGTVNTSLAVWDAGTSTWVENPAMISDGNLLTAPPDTAVDASPASDIYVVGGEKTAGTGDGGVLYLRGGASFGGAAGKVILSGSEVESFGTTLVGTKDNATAIRVRGPQDPSEGASQVQSYSGIFHNAAYNTVGTLKTRFITGANVEMDLEVQSPHALLLTAVDDGHFDGVIKARSKTFVEISSRCDAEVDAPKKFVVDRVFTGATGAANTSDVLIKVTSGDLRVGSHLIPDLDITRDLGSSSFRWRDLYISDGSIRMGTTPATAGSVRLPYPGTIAWRNFGNTGNITVAPNSADVLAFSSGLTSPFALTSTSAVNTTRFLAGTNPTDNPISISGVGGSPIWASYNVSDDASGSQRLDTFRSIRYSNFTSDTTAITMARGRGSFSSPVLVAVQDSLGLLNFLGYDGTQWNQAAQIEVKVDDTPGLTVTPGVNSMPATMIFRTTPDGSASPVERMRFTSEGNLNFGDTENAFRFVQFVPLQSFTLADAQASPATIFSVTSASYVALIIEYSVARGGINKTGTIRIANDGSAPGIDDQGASTGAIGITFSADVSGGNLRLRYTSTSTGFAGTMHFHARRWA